MTAVAFVVAAVVGTLARAVLTQGQPEGEIPWRTLSVNVAGSFALGLVLAAGWFENPVVVATAGLGSFTTFSTVVAETAALFDDDRRTQAFAYVGLTLVVGIAAAWVGLVLGEAQ